MTDEEIVQRVAAMWSPAGVFATKSHKPQHAQAFKTQIRGRRAVEWMARLRPYMGSRRQGQIDRAVLGYVSKQP